MPQYALVCSPADTVARALRMQDLGQVDVPLLHAQHADYVSALQSFDTITISMPPQKEYPDSTFVEDPAVNIGNRLLVIARLRNPARRGEEKLMERALTPLFARMPIARIKPPGFVEGGDVLVGNGTLYIGISKRTNADGAEQLARIAHDQCKWKSKIIPIPASYLHLKGEVTFHHRGNFITVSEEIVEHFKDSKCKLLVTPQEERFAGNCISYNSAILVHANCKKTIKLLKRNKLAPRPIDLSEFAKIDGAMTCLSKFFAF